MKRVLIFQDTDRIGKTIDLLDAAGKMYGEEPFETFAVVSGASCEALSGFFHHVIHVDRTIAEPHDQKAVCGILAQLQNTYNFDSILVPATPFGRMIAPRLAKKLKTGLVADVTDIRRRESRLEIIRPAYSGRLMAGIEILGKGPVMMSIRPGVFSFEGKGGVQTQVTEHTDPVEEKSRLKCLAVKEKKTSYDIRESEILISGGGGVLRGFAGLEKLAEALNGKVSASRKIVDKGIAPRSIQVGQSGRTVSPRLYIALGINGAIQHVEGLKNIETIISVNTNRNAPICSLSDLVVEGDAMEFIDRLTDRIRAFRKEAQ